MGSFDVGTKKTYNDWMFAVKYDELSSRNQGRDSWERHRDTGLILKTQHVSSLQRPQGWTQIRRTGNSGHTEKKGSSQNYFLIKKNSNLQLLCSQISSFLLLPPSLSFSPYPGPLCGVGAGDGLLGRRDKLFQKCPAFPPGRLRCFVLVMTPGGLYLSCCVEETAPHGK